MTNEPVILYVEDDPFSCQVMELLLIRKLQFKSVTIFESSANFMQRLGALPKKPDVFLLDIHMEPHDGFDLLKMLRAHPDYGTSKIVALTASVMNEEVEQLRRAGFDSVLAKPVDQSTFPMSLKRILDGENIWTVI
jgi:CheY-like chemotaxis protein